MTKRTASSVASFLWAAVMLPIWVLFLSICSVEFADHYNPAGVALWPAFAVVISIPFGLVVGLVVAPVIYYRCEQSGWRRYGRSVLVHVGVAIAVSILYLMMPIIPRFLMYAAAIFVVCAPEMLVPSLVGCLAFAYESSPRVKIPAERLALQR